MLRRVTAIVAVVIGIAIYAYFAWAFSRFSGEALIEPEWPRVFPYPDTWLLELNDFYDRKYPVNGPYLKTHGEQARVLRDVTWASRAGVTFAAMGLATLVVPLIRRHIRSRQRGFDVLVKTDSAGAPDR